MPTQKRIGLYYAGGLERGFASQAALQRWLDDFVEMQMVATVSPTLVVEGRRAVRLADLKRLAKMLVQDWKKRDGFVVCLDAERLLYHANLLAAILGDVGKPVIITAGTEQRSANDYLNLGMRATLVNAALAAVADFRGIALLKGPELVPVTTALRSGENSFVGTGKSFGRIDFGIQLAKGAPARLPQALPKLNACSGQVAYFEVDGSRPELPPIPANSLGVIIDGGQSLSLAVTKQLPKNKPALLIAAESAHLVERGNLTEVGQLTPAAAAARFTCRLKKGKTKNLLQGLLEESP